MLMVLLGAAVAAILVVAWSLLGGCLVIRWLNRKIEDEKAELALHIRSFTESPSDDTPSPLALIADEFAILFAGRLWQHMEARIRGGNAVATKEMIQGEQAALAASSPGMALVTALLPKKIKNMLQKNAMMVGALSNLAAGGGQPGGGDHGSTGSTSRKNRD